MTFPLMKQDYLLRLRVLKPDPSPLASHLKRYILTRLCPRLPRKVEIDFSVE